MKFLLGSVNIFKKLLKIKGNIYFLQQSGNSISWTKVSSTVYTGTSTKTLSSGALEKLPFTILFTEKTVRPLIKSITLNSNAVCTNRKCSKMIEKRIQRDY